MLIKYHQLKGILQYFFALEFWREPSATTKKKTRDKMIKSANNAVMLRTTDALAADLFN